MALQIYTPPSQQEFLLDLTNTIGFTPEDLTLNRAGKVSSSQMAKLAVRAFKPLWMAGSALAGWFLFIYIIDMFVPNFLEGLLFKKVGAGTAAITFGAVLSFVVALLKSSRTTFLLAYDLIAGKIATVEGRVSPSWEEEDAEGIGKLYGHKIAAYRFCIKQDQFEVSARAHDLLMSKYDNYHPYLKIYFTPSSKLLVSVEPTR